MWEAKKLVSGAATRQNDERAMSYLNRKTLVLAYCSYYYICHVYSSPVCLTHYYFLTLYLVHLICCLCSMYTVSHQKTCNLAANLPLSLTVENFFKVDQHFLKLWTNIESHVFMAHRVVDCCHWHYAQCLLCNSFAQYNFRASHLCYDYASTYNNGLILTSFTLFATIS